jgi:hypothetical protein
MHASYIPMVEKACPIRNFWFLSFVDESSKESD